MVSCCYPMSQHIVLNLHLATIARSVVQSQPLQPQVELSFIPKLPQNTAPKCNIIIMYVRMVRNPGWADRLWEGSLCHQCVNVCGSGECKWSRLVKCFIKMSLFTICHLYRAPWLLWVSPFKMCFSHRITASYNGISQKIGSICICCMHMLYYLPMPTMMP